MLGVGELVALDAAGGLVFVFGATEEDSSCGGETDLGAVVMGKLSSVVVVVLIEFDLSEDSLTTISYWSNGVDGVVLGDGDWRVTDALDAGFFGAVVVEKFHAAVFHSDSVGEDDAVSATGDYDVILLAPGNALDFASVASKSHSRGVLPSIELKEM